jgi:rubrerythrin
MIARLPGVEDPTVIRNLETAFEEETKTCAACKAYAVRADEEGYHGIASLFRATAQAEQIHASNHARVLRHLGGSTLIDVPSPRVEGTLENLRAALVDQKFEVDYLYPSLLVAAVPLFDSKAIRSFHWALEADKSHVRIYRELMPHVNAGGSSGWMFEPHDYFVCGYCAYAAEKVEGENCPTCNYVWEKFEKVR